MRFHAESVTGSSLPRRAGVHLTFPHRSGRPPACNSAPARCEAELPAKFLSCPGVFAPAPREGPRGPIPPRCHADGAFAARRGGVRGPAGAPGGAWRCDPGRPCRGERQSDFAPMAFAVKEDEPLSPCRCNHRAADGELGCCSTPVCNICFRGTHSSAGNGIIRFRCAYCGTTLEGDSRDPPVAASGDAKPSTRIYVGQFDGGYHLSVGGADKRTAELFQANGLKVDGTTWMRAVSALIPGYWHQNVSMGSHDDVVQLECPRREPLDRLAHLVQTAHQDRGMLGFAITRLVELRLEAKKRGGIVP